MSDLQQEKNSPIALATVWNLILVAAVWASSLSLSYEIVLGTGAPSAMYWFFTALFCLDVVADLLWRRAPAMAVGGTVPDMKAYLRGWFAVDVIAAVPMLALAGDGPVVGGMRAAAILGALRLLKLLKVRRALGGVSGSLYVNPAIMRLTVFAFWFTLICHFMALGWVLIGAAESGRGPVDTYIRSLYWCLTTVATIGYGDYVPDRNSNVQIIYTMVVQVLGVGMYGYIIGSISGLIANLDVAKAKFLKKVEAVDDYMRVHRVPPTLRQRVRDYYAYLWQTRRGGGSSDALAELPHTLQQDISLFINRQILHKAALFRGADELFIREVVGMLKPMIFLPGDYIIRQGAHSDCMYFMDEGEVEVLVDADRVAVLGAGSPFGESALVQEANRNASVRALTYCHVYQLSKKDFSDLCLKHPEFDAQIRQVAQSRSRLKTDSQDIQEPSQ
ncbi:MAG: cyclic nucleotide-binding domain-containing protein [Phycisphaerae bacterium]